MSDAAIVVNDLGKKFLIGHEKSGDLRESIGNRLRQLFQSPIESEEFWALKNISFEVKNGEALGIIGKNGAGKSTLLKILSRITEPTTGRFEINGRVSSLLEVGTGFHPELSGRENIFLNGTILGMKRKEIKLKFEQIVDFSGISKFIDTPVKHYSSGMKVRLAFSVAAHLDPEILIVDEVLAVGDAEFQKKCIGKMDEVSKSRDRVVLFVSHNMSALKSLCNGGICLQNGSIAYHGTIHKAIETYMTRPDANKNTQEVIDYRLNDTCSLERFSIGHGDVESMTDFDFKVVVSSTEINCISEMSLLFYNELQERVAIVDLRDEMLFSISGKSNRLIIDGTIRDIPFVEGKYTAGLYIASNLCTGNFLEIAELTITGKKSALAPYPVNARGFMEIKNEFRIYA